MTTAPQLFYQPWP